MGAGEIRVPKATPRVHQTPHVFVNIKNFDCT